MIFCLADLANHEDMKSYLDTKGNMIQFVDGPRGKRQLSINNFGFTKMNDLRGVSYWRFVYFSAMNWEWPFDWFAGIMYYRCTQYKNQDKNQKRCPARVQFSQEGLNIVSLEHNHGHRRYKQKKKKYNNFLVI